MTVTAAALWGSGKDLDVVQMCCRSIIVFFIAYLLIRISGRRSFGIRSPVDNIIVILLGAILSRAIVGASPFLPVVSAATTIAFMHRICAWVLCRYPLIAKQTEGEKILLYQDGIFREEQLKRALINREDIMQAVRSSIQADHLDDIAKVYIERNGEISIVRKTPVSQEKT